MRYTLLTAVFISTLFFGCSDDPEKKAAKEVRKSTERAQTIISETRTKARDIMLKSDEGSNAGFTKAQALMGEGLDKARAELEISLTKNRNSGEAKIPALMTSGNIAFSQALKIQSQLAGESSPLSPCIESISVNAQAMEELSAMRSHRKAMINANNSELNHFKNLLNVGTDKQASLKSQLREYEAENVNIEKQIKSQQVKVKNAIAESNKIEKEATAKLRAAEAMSGDEQLALQNEAYDLRLSMKKYTLANQRARDKIAELKSRASIVAPMITKLIDDINAAEAKIKKIQAEGANSKLLRDVSDINTRYNEYAKSLKTNINTLRNTLNVYSSMVDESIRLFGDAISQYGKIRKGSGVKTGQNRKAACLLWKAGVYAESLTTEKNVLAKLRSISVSSPGVAGEFNDVVQVYTAKAAEHTTEALKNYDLAAADYKGISGRGEFDCAVRKSHILTLCGKIALAEYMAGAADNKGEKDKYNAIADDASNVAESLVAKVKECDPQFETSVTGRMLEGKSDYKPKLRVDMAGYYEDIVRDELQNWKNLQGTQKETEVNRLIKKLIGLKNGDDPAAFENILEPELRLLREAKKKGFEENSEDDEDF